jgi:hypothetical protein
MKLLLDENIPIKLCQYFSGDNQVFTIKDMNWTGVKNGRLLNLMAKYGFDALITIDKNLKHQQNLEHLDIKIFILNSPNNKLSTLIPYVKAFEDEISKLKAEKVWEITL